MQQTTPVSSMKRMLIINTVLQQAAEPIFAQKVTFFPEKPADDELKIDEFAIITATSTGTRSNIQ